MHTSKHIFNPAAALAKVFCAPTAKSSQVIISKSTPLVATSRRCAHHTLPNTERRPTTTIKAIDGTRLSLTSKLPSSQRHIQRYKRHVPNANTITGPLRITQPYIHIRNEDGELLPAQPTKRVILSLRPSETLRIVYQPPKRTLDSTTSSFSSSPSSEPIDPNAPSWPICTIVDKEAQKALDKARKTDARKLQVRTKEMELNWAIAGGDLETKLKQLKGFLAKGMRVEVTMLNKNSKRNGKTRATMEAARGMLERVQTVVEEVPGVREWKKGSGEVGGLVRMYVEGPAGGLGKVDEEVKVAVKVEESDGRLES